MANAYSSLIQEDGPRNAVIKITGVLDSTDAVLEPAVTLSDFTNNAPYSPNGYFVGFRIDHIWHSIGDGLEVQIQWNGRNPQPIFAVAGRGRESFDRNGGLQPNQANPGYDGSINVFTTGYGTGENAGMTIQNFTLTLEMVKLYSQKNVLSAA
jgi:hypothetical protein